MMPSEVPPPKKRGKHRMGATDQTSAVMILAKQREADALRLRIRGKNLDQIAEELNFSDKSAARKAIVRGMQSLGREPAIEYLNLLVVRIESLYQVAQDLVDESMQADGNREIALKAVKECRENAMDTARLLGLVKTKVDVEVQPSSAERWERVKAWLAEPTPELEDALRAAGWVRVGGAIETEGASVSGAELSE